ncbi:MAG: type II toxin-antitoxin system PemK/MazF family toxin [Chloroflexi bacterium]|nr:type II toxin-antitoxin system PemK/MazF family toxin [Chloroflexota bacterium]
MLIQHTIDYKRGDIVLVRFVFPDQSGVKRRPALIVSSETYHQGRHEVVLAAVTSNVRRILPGDTVLQDWQGAGLISPSVVTGILRTVTGAALARRLGRLLAQDSASVEANLRLSLAL